MNKLFILLLSVFFVVIYSSCSNSNNNETTTKNAIAEVSPKENFKTGEIIDSLSCKTNANNVYSAYLPITYDITKKQAILIAFDPKASGKTPLELYKTLAEEYNYILIGSNSLKNGIEWEESKLIIDQLLTDVMQRFAIDSHRIYLTGFSGGARLANATAILSPMIEGVICCGAAYPAANSTSPRNNYTFIGLVGLNDFNYTEMYKYEMIDIAGHNLKHTLVTYDGKHEWPAKEIMNEAFLWLELCQMRKDVQSKNTALINKYLTVELKKLDELMTNKEYYKASLLCKKTIHFYDGLADLKPCYDAYSFLKTNDEVSIGMGFYNELLQTEEKLKQKYMQGIINENYAWWQKEIASLNQKVKTEKELALKQMNSRLLQYCSLLAYMQTS
ncbi:MAG: hypothetical protein JNL69_02815, partial [Bacteroidia bacterium]|nr:hypothetical protein [Bacteroidia bacterium]